MLPEFGKGIPKPLKKRYRDFFKDEGNPPNIRIPKVSENELGTLAYTDPSHIAVTKEKLNYHQLNRPIHLYRKSVIKRSITKHISIIDIEQMTPKLADPADAPKTAQDQAKFRLETADENQTSHYVYLSKEYLGNSPEVRFIGKLKVKWLEKYENFGKSDINGVNERGAKVLDNFEPYGCGKSAEKKTKFGGKFKREPTRKTKRFKANDDAEESISDGDKITDQSEDVPVRKLERARKGLIYQKFMASTYSWNKKEKSSTSKSPTEVTQQQQPRKRGRPRSVPKPETCPKPDDFAINESTVTVMRLERKKNSDTLKYAVVERKNSKKSSL